MKRTGFFVKHRKKIISSITALNVAALSVSRVFAVPSGVDTSSYSGMVDIVFWVATIAPWCHNGFQSSGRWGCWGSLGGCGRRSSSTAARRAAWRFI